MKKMLAILMAALMALSCTLALAENGDVEAASSSGALVTAALSVDREVLANVLSTFGVPDEIAGIADTVAAVLSEAGERLVATQNGIEYALTLKGSDIASLTALADESGVSLASSVIPGYVLNLSTETISALAEQLNSALDGIDTQAALEALSGYLDQFVETCAGAVSLGEVEQGEYDVNGVSYNAMTPVNVDLAGIVAAEQTLAKQLLEDEAIQGALQALQGAGVSVSTDGLEEMSQAAVSLEELPTLDMKGYMNVDEDGIPDGNIDMVFSVYAPGSEEAATEGDVLVQGDNVTVNVQFLTADARVTVAGAPTEDGFQVRVDADVQGIYAGFDSVCAMGEALTIDTAVYLLDSEKPLLSEHCDITFDEVEPLSIDAEGKTVVAIEELMGENADETINALTSDLVNNGLGSVISAALDAMPEEIGGLAGLLIGGASAEEAPAA